MKRILFSCLILTTGGWLSAIEMPCLLKEGEVKPLIINNNITIGLKNRTVTFDLFNDFYEVSIDSVYNNKGPSKTIIVGNSFSEDVAENPEVYDVSAYINNEETISIKNKTDSGIIYTREVTFPEKKATTIGFHYSSIYKGERDISFSFEQDRYWDEVTGIVIVKIINHTNHYFTDLTFDGQNLERWNVIQEEDSSSLSFGWINSGGAVKTRIGLKNVFFYSQKEVNVPWLESIQSLIPEEDRDYYDEERVNDFLYELKIYNEYVLLSTQEIDIEKETEWGLPLQGEIKKSDIGLFSNFHLSLSSSKIKEEVIGSWDMVTENEKDKGTFFKLDETGNWTMGKQDDKAVGKYLIVQNRIVLFLGRHKLYFDYFMDDMNREYISSHQWDFDEPVLFRKLD